MLKLKWPFFFFSLPTFIVCFDTGSGKDLLSHCTQEHHDHLREDVEYKSIEHTQGQVETHFLESSSHGSGQDRYLLWRCSRYTVGQLHSP